MNSLHHPRGQSLLEVILAATLISAGLVAALALATNSQRSADFSKNNNTAGNFNYQVVDWLREIRDSEGWGSFSYYLQADTAGSQLTYCLNSALPTAVSGFADLTAGSSCDSASIPNTIFSREVTLNLSLLDSGLLTGTVSTSWVDRTTHSNKLEFEMTKWQ